MTAHVFVDPPGWTYRGMLMCHMISPNLDALHQMADTIGVARRWFQDPVTMPKVSLPHYDIAKSKRALAVRAGAIECSRQQAALITRVIKRDVFNLDIDVLHWLRMASPEKVPFAEAWLSNLGIAP